MNESQSSVLRHMAKRVRRVEDGLLTSCVAESAELIGIADDLESLASWMWRVEQDD